MNAFTVSNVEFNDIKVVAPTLRHWIHYLGPSTYRIAYMPTQMHPLDVKIGGVVIGRFFVEEGKVHRRLSDSVPRGAHADCQALVPGEDAALVEHCCSPDGASENEIRELTAKNEKLTKQLAQSADAEKRIADAVSERAAAVSERDAAVSGREAAESEADKLRKQIPDHPAALVDAQKAIGAVEKERDEAVEARQAAEAETEKLKTQIDDPPAALAKAEKARDTAEADRDAVVKDRDTAKSDLKHANSEIATLRKQVDDHTEEFAEANAAREKSEAETKELREQIKTLVQPAVLDEAVRARKSAEAETAKLREQVKTVPADAQNLIAIKTARDTAQSENVELNEKVGKLTAELAASEKTSKDAVSDLDISKAKTATLQKQVDDHPAALVNAVKMAKAEAETLRKKVQTLSTNAGELTDKLSTAEEERDAANLEIENLQKLVNDHPAALAQETATLRDQVKTLSDNAEKDVKNLADTENARKAAVDALDTEKKKCDIAKANNVTLQTQVNAHSAETEKLTSTLKAVQ
eukprot:93820_1